jgi:hypothetical protein
VDSHQWSHHSGVARCTVAIFDVLSSDAPSELVSFVVQSQGKSSISSPTTVPEMLAPEVTSSDCGRGKPDTHQNFMSQVGYKKGQMGAVSRKYRLNSEKWTGMHKQVRSWFNFSQ